MVLLLFINYKIVINIICINEKDSKGFNKFVCILLNIFLIKDKS